MPPMWTVPLRVMVSSRSPLGAMGLRQRTRGPSVVSGSGDGPAGAMGPVSWRGRGAWAISVASQACCGVMRPGRPWWGRWVLQGVVEAVDLLLELGDGVGQGLLVQVAEQGLVEALVLALGGGVVGFAGGGLDAQGAHVPHQAAGDSAPAGARGRAVVGRAGAGCTPRAATPLSKTSMAA